MKITCFLYRFGFFGVGREKLMPCNDTHELWPFTESVLYELDKQRFYPTSVSLHIANDHDGVDYLYGNDKKRFMFIARLEDSYSFGYGEHSDDNSSSKNKSFIDDSAILPHTKDNAVLVAQSFIDLFSQMRV
ncbi:hypothetical protein ABMX62_19245 [Vibrio vulnificus]|uniref:hypothetical protein n=1 Tax=Vibrio vulnificus TaxID=672 RepID=UPI004058568A